MSSELFDRHRAMLELVLRALATRDAFSAYAANPADYNEILAAEGRTAFANYCNSYFYLDQPGPAERTGEESSPYGLTMGIQYPKANLNAVLPAASRAKDAWSRESPDVRAGVCMEILHQLNTRSFEIALATMHTSGAPFDLAFRYGGPYAQERGLEAVAICYQELMSIPRAAVWESQERGSRERIAKTFHAVGLGVGLVIGCANQATWNAYPGLFADLMAGNAVVVKPHPLAVLPLAISVGVARRVLVSAGFDPDLVNLIVDEAAFPLAQMIAVRPEVRLIDFAGSTAFADWLATNARQAKLHALTGAVNPVVIDSTENLQGMLQNLVRSSALFAGRMCTSPRVLFLSQDGVGSPTGVLDLETFGTQLAQSFAHLLGDPVVAGKMLGSVRPGEYAALLERAAEAGEVVVDSTTFEHPDFPGATAMTPLVVRLRMEQVEVYGKEWFGPVLFLVQCESVSDAIAQAALVAREGGAVVASLYSCDVGVRTAAEDAFASSGASLCINFTGEALMNHAASFSDFHGSGQNPFGNVTLTDSAFVVGRYRVVSARTRV